MVYITERDIPAHERHLVPFQSERTACRTPRSDERDTAPARTASHTHPTTHTRSTTHGS